MVSSIMLLIRSQPAPPAGERCHHRLTVVRLQEVLSSRCGHDARLGIGEVKCRAPPLHLASCSPAACLGNGFPYLLQPTLRKPTPAERLSLPPPFMQQLRYLDCLLHVRTSPYASMRWPDLRAVQRHVPQLHQPRLAQRSVRTGPTASTLSLRKSEMVRKSGVLFAEP